MANGLPHPGAGPFEIGPADGPQVVLFHGLTGAPSELWPLACGLARAGYRVRAPTWPGHGQTPERLAETSAEALLDQAREIASDRNVVALGGLSMGALLATIAASERPDLKALVLLAPALRLHGRNRYFMAAARVPILSRLPLLIPKGKPETGAAFAPVVSLWPEAGIAAEAGRAAEQSEQRPGADGRYDRIPLRWGAELRRLQLMAADVAPRVTCPVLVMHGLADRTADPDGAVRMTQLVGGAVHARFFPESPHVLTLGPDRGVVTAETVRWLAPLVPATPVAAHG